MKTHPAPEQATGYRASAGRGGLGRRAPAPPAAPAGAACTGRPRGGTPARSRAHSHVPRGASIARIASGTRCTHVQVGARGMGPCRYMPHPDCGHMQRTARGRAPHAAGPARASLRGVSAAQHASVQPSALAHAPGRRRPCMRREGPVNRGRGAQACWAPPWRPWRPRFTTMTGRPTWPDPTLSGAPTLAATASALTTTTGRPSESTPS